MKKQVILLMQGSQYPFGQADQASGGKSKFESRILVRKKHNTFSLQQRNQLLDKIFLLKTISSPFLMKIETVLEQQSSIHTLYEYVPHSLAKKIKNLSDANIQKIKNSLLQLGVTLAQIGLIADWDDKNIGLNQKLQVKYYLDLDKAKVDGKIGKNNIQKKHFQGIMEIFSEFSNIVPPKNNNSNKNSLIKQATKGKNFDMKQQTNSLLYARQASSIDSKYDSQKIKQIAQIQIQTKKKNIQQSKKQQKKIQKQHQTQGQKQKVINKLQLKPKQKQKQKPEQKVPMRKSKTNWKQINQNSDFIQDFINVLDDKSQNAQSKYISDQQLYEQQMQLDDQSVQIKEFQTKTNKLEYADKNQGQQQFNSKISSKKANKKNQMNATQYDQQEIVWISGPDKNEKEYETRSNKKSQEEEIVWVDYRDFRDIQERAQAAIRRSSNALQIFKGILSKYK